MGKRSTFQRRERDWYPTPAAAVLPLLPHLGPLIRFAEPCAGDGRLIDALEAAGHRCVWASDIEPRRADITENDAEHCGSGAIDCFITNPPWSRSVLHPIIRNLARQRPAWLLFDADWVHTRQSAELIPWLVKIVSVGRVKWIEDSPFTGKDNCAWHLFDARNAAPAQFFGRIIPTSTEAQAA